MTGQSFAEGSNIRDFICNAGAGAAAGAIAATFVCPLDVIKTRLQVHGLPPGHEGGIIITSLQNIVKKEGLKDDDRDGQLSTGANMVAAAGAGAATACTTNPLWVVKTRLQTQGMRTDVVPYKGVISALSRITQEEGFRGLYSGILPSLVGVSHVAIQFPAYEKIKHYMAKKENTNVENLSPTSVAIASSISKVLASIMTYPHEVIRSRLQEQGQARNTGARYAGVIDCIKKLFLKEGIPGFYRGCATNLLRTTPSAVITFTSYEMIHRFLQGIIPPEEKYSQTPTGPDDRGNGEASNIEVSQKSEAQSFDHSTSWFL